MNEPVTAQLIAKIIATQAQHQTEEHRQPLTQLRNALVGPAPILRALYSKSASLDLARACRAAGYLLAREHIAGPQLRALVENYMSVVPAASVNDAFMAETLRLLGTVVRLHAQVAVLAQLASDDPTRATESLPSVVATLVETNLVAGLDAATAGRPLSVQDDPAARERH